MHPDQWVMRSENENFGLNVVDRRFAAKAFEKERDARAESSSRYCTMLSMLESISSIFDKFTFPHRSLGGRCPDIAMVDLAAPQGYKILIAWASSIHTYAKGSPMIVDGKKAVPQDIHQRRIGFDKHWTLAHNHGHVVITAHYRA
jgi:hypothetical protein